ELQVYVTRFSDKALIGEARAKLREAKDRLADWDAGVAQHYFRIRWYAGAIGRLVPLMASDPEYTRRDFPFYSLGAAYLQVHRPPPDQRRLAEAAQGRRFLRRPPRRLDHRRRREGHHGHRQGDPCLRRNPRRRLPRGLRRATGTAGGGNRDTGLPESRPPGHG